MLTEGPGTCVHCTPSLGGRVTSKVEESAGGPAAFTPCPGLLPVDEGKAEPGEKNDRTRWRSRLKWQAMF